MKALRSLLGQSAPQPKQVGLVCNYTSCMLGSSVFSKLQTHIPTIGVAFNAKDSNFECYLNEQSERDRLIAYLKQNNMQVKYLVFNQPFKLRPVVDDPIDAESDDDKEDGKVEELKDKVRILVETPLFTVADLN